MSLAERETNGYAKSQLKELGPAALKPGLSFQGEGVRPVPPLPVLHPQKHWPQEGD